MLYYEPFYQFMRQQFLAAKMEAAREMGADVVSLLHISPDENGDFKRITSPLLKGLGRPDGYLEEVGKERRIFP